LQILPAAGSRLFCVRAPNRSSLTTDQNIASSPAIAGPVESRLGIVYGVLAYGAWGLVPLYFKQVAQVAPLDVLANRIVWSVMFLLVPVTLHRRWPDVMGCFRSRRKLSFLLASTLAVAVNWFTFIYAIANNKILQSSLGYFMNPLVNVMLGMIFLGERLRTGQLAALLLAVVGVGNMVAHNGSLPVISIVLATSFGSYALLRKTMPVGPLVGSLVETTLMLPLGLVIVSRQVFREVSTTGTLDARTWGWLLCAGVVTAVPLLWFAGAARRLRLATMGFLQYLSPTGQFLLAVFAYREPFTRTSLLSFSLIWIALVIYSADSLRAYHLSRDRDDHTLPAVAPE
jgi:chloramphenicol-sensitive protein RarD